ncbi:MAG: sugar ABC transporter substrate-binding protein [Planctomycetales bacterium]|nr:sugar ABC transporter substrate-binding protein [Planctomycetales bacterium]
MSWRWMRYLLASAMLFAAGCGNNKPAAQQIDGQLRIGIAFETLQTEYWVASLDNLRNELNKRNAEIVEVVADGDANRQLEQVQSLITRHVDGIVLVPKDSRTCVPMIRAANKANIPIVLYNRGAATGAGPHVVVVADNRSITRATVSKMVEVARQRGRKLKAAILIGDLGDINAIERREGFDEIVAENPDVVEVVARIPTEWNQEKAFAGITNALQANPEIEFIFCSSDFLFPSVISALKSANRYLPVNDPNHVVLGGFDGDATAYGMLKEGYLDADGVQDVQFECQQAVDALYKMNRGETVDAVLPDPGFVIHQGNLETDAERMWGSQVGSHK